MNNASKHFFETGKPKKEQRGGSRVTQSQLAVTSSIVNFIKKLKVSESHYGRGKSSKQSLPSDLSIAKLWRLWKAEREAGKMRAIKIVLVRIN